MLSRSKWGRRFQLPRLLQGLARGTTRHGGQLVSCDRRLGDGGLNCSFLSRVTLIFHMHYFL